MIRPKISIITVVYNLFENKRIKNFIHMIESIKSQNYGNIEHIVIDGNSTDGTKDFLKSLNVLFFSKTDHGIYEAMNNGIKKATGKYITFLNSDDFYYDENAIKNSIIALEKSNADFSFGMTKYIDDNGNIVNGILQEVPNVKNLFLTMPFSHQSMIIKSDILRKNLFDTKYKIVSDYKLVLKLFLENKKYIYIPEYIVYFQTGGTSSDIKNVHLEMFKLYKELFQKTGINISSYDIQKLEIKKIIPQNIVRILNKKVKFKINRRISNITKSSKQFSLFGVPFFKTIKAKDFTDFYIFNVIKLLRIVSKTC